MRSQPEKLQKKLNEIVEGETYRHSFWGIGLADRSSGEILVPVLTNPQK